MTIAIRPNGSSVCRFASAVWIIPFETSVKELKRVEQNLVTCPLLFPSEDR